MNELATWKNKDGTGSTFDKQQIVVVYHSYHRLA